MAVLGDGGATCSDRKFSWYSYCYSYSMDEPLALLSGQSWQEWCGHIQKQSDLAPSLTVDCLAESANASPIHW